MSNIILRLPEVLVRTGLSKSSIYVFISNGKFPRSIFLGARAVGWLESDIENWIRQRVAASHTPSLANTRRSVL